MSDDADVQPSQQTLQLLQLLGAAGFSLTDRHVGSVNETDGIVEHVGQGIWVHADPDMVRLVVEESAGNPGYRLTLGRRDLGRNQALQIIAVHARAALRERSR
jgi:hypothetical protein